MSTNTLEEPNKLVITENNIDTAVDILNRDKFVHNLINITNNLANKKSSCTFAIDGKWGVGKSFVLNMFLNKIGQCQDENTSQDKYLVFNYNCWKYDYYQEPLIAIVSSMLSNAENKTKLFSEKANIVAAAVWGKAKDTLKNIADKWVKSYIGIEPIKFIDSIEHNCTYQIENNHSFDEYFKFNETLEDTRKLLKQISQNQTIIIVVDEIDRCLPEYSIKVLERLHHLFDGLDNVIVVISLDKEQLENTIKQIYGNKIDIDGYLKKFISFQLKLNKGIINENFKDKFNQYISLFDEAKLETKFSIDDYLSNLFEGIDIRTQIKIIEKVQLAHELVFSEKKDYGVMCMELLWAVLEYHGQEKNGEISLKRTNTLSSFIFNNKKVYFSEKVLNFFHNVFNQIKLKRNKSSNNKKNQGFLSNIGVPEIIFYYWCRLYNNSDTEYQLDNNTPNFNEYSVNSEKLKDFRDIFEMLG